MDVSTPRVSGLGRDALADQWTRWAQLPNPSTPWDSEGGGGSAAPHIHMETLRRLGYTGPEMSQGGGDVSNDSDSAVQPAIQAWMESTGYMPGTIPTYNGGHVQAWLDRDGRELADTRWTKAASDDSQFWSAALGLGGLIAGPLMAPTLGAAGAGAVLGGGSAFVSGADAQGVLRGALGGGLGAGLASGAGQLAGSAASGYGSTAEVAARNAASGFTRGALSGALRGDFDLESAIASGLSSGVGAGVTDYVGGDFGRFAGQLAGGTVAGLGRGGDLTSSLQNSLLPAVIGTATNLGRTPASQRSTEPTPARNEVSNTGGSMFDDYDGPGGSYIAPQQDFGNFLPQESFSPEAFTPSSGSFDFGSFAQNPPDAFGWSGMGSDTNANTPDWALAPGEAPFPRFEQDRPWWGWTEPPSLDSLPSAGYSNEGRNYPTPESTQGPGGSPVNSEGPGFLSQVGSWLRGSGGLGNLVRGVTGGGAPGVAGMGAGGQGANDGSFMNLLGMIGLLSSLQQSRRGGTHSPSDLRAMLPQNSQMNEVQSAASSRLLAAPLTRYTMPTGDDSRRRYGVDLAAPGYAHGGEVGALGRITRDLDAYVHEGPGYVSDGEGGGQDDLVDAKLSPGEYVFDADVVSALGDGSNEEGARRLDAMRMGIRAHKRGGSVKTIPPKALAPLTYLKKATS